MTTGRGSTRIEVYLATLTHPDLAGLAAELDGFTLDGCLRVANWRDPFTSRGDTFIPGFFKVKRPDLGVLKGTLKLSIENVDRRITRALKTLTGAPVLTLEKVYAHDPDTVVRTWRNLELITSSIDQSEVANTFGPPRTEGPFMGITTNPADYPGLFT